MKRFKLILLILIPGLHAFAGNKTGTSDTINQYSSVSLISIIEKSKAAFSETELVNIIDSLMELDRVDQNYYTYINKRIEKHICPANGMETENILPGNEFYQTWDNKNFYNNKDLLDHDTVVSIVLLDSIHNKYVHPCPGIITSIFGWRDNAPHNGIDLDLNKGDKVFVAFDGMVRMAIRHAGYGNVVVVRHYNGLETTYAHLSKIKVKTGQVLKAGDVVGLGGSTGKSTGSHLHFEVRFKGVAINPKDVISFTDQKLICDKEILIRKNKWGTYAYPKFAEFYTVKKGDSLYAIAKRYGVTTTYLRELNGMSKKVYLKVGYKLRVS